MRKDSSSKTTLSFIIVYYKCLGDLINLLKSIKENDIGVSYEIIVVNNNPEESIKMPLLKTCHDLVYIASPNNIGYGSGNNLGIKYARGEYLFILNPDTWITKGRVRDAINILNRDPGVAIVAPNLVDNSGVLFEKQGTRTLTPITAMFSLTFLSRLFPNNRYLRDFYMLDVSKSDLRQVEVVPGTAFIVRKSVFYEIGGFDQNFFLFFEETDLCMRISSRGYKILTTPDLVIAHDWIPGEGGKSLKRVFAKSRFYFFKKHYGYLSAIIVELSARLTKTVVCLTLLLVVGLLSYWWYNR